jgi:hypothetical protein
MRVATVESTTLATVAYDENRNCCNWSFVARRFTCTSVFPLRCTKPCSARLPKAGISIRPFADGFPIVWSGVSKQFRGMRKCRPGTMIRRTHGAHSGGVAGWQPDH